MGNSVRNSVRACALAIDNTRPYFNRPGLEASAVLVSIPSSSGT